jgi:hypothetical protein
LSLAIEAHGIDVLREYAILACVHGVARGAGHALEIVLAAGPAHPQGSLMAAQTLFVLGTGGGILAEDHVDGGALLVDVGSARAVAGLADVLLRERRPGVAEHRVRCR